MSTDISHRGQPIKSVQRQGESTVAGISTHADQRNEANEGKSAEALRRAEAWFAGQKEAFQAAMNGATLEISLDSLSERPLSRLTVTAGVPFTVSAPTGPDCTTSSAWGTPMPGEWTASKLVQIRPRAAWPPGPGGRS